MEKVDQEKKVVRKDNVFHPLVSIVIPVYNGANYMREAIDSALSQTYDNIEIIVVNDGSTDDTEVIAKSYGDKIRYFKKENGGVASALNLGIKEMKGDYFSWLSHDDVYYPNKISRQIEEISIMENPNTIIMSDLDGIDENYNKIYETNYIERINEYEPRRRSKLYPIVYNQTYGCTLLIPQKCFEEVGMFDATLRVAQDFELFYRIFSKFPNKLVSEALVTVRDSSKRQGIIKRSQGNEEYSALYIRILEDLSDVEISLLAPSIEEFVKDMKDFFNVAGYTIALEYIKKKYFSNIQVSSYDLIGNKFNGYNLHLNLRERGIDSKCMVLHKESKDDTVFQYDFLSLNGTKNILSQRLILDTDIIHLHLIHQIFDLNYLPIITRVKPTVISLHDPFFLSGHCVHHFDCQKWEKHCMDCPYLDREFFLDRDTSALNYALKKDAIQNSNISAIVASRWMMEKIQKSPIWKNKKIYLLPFGINHETFKPVATSSPKQKFDLDENSIVVMFRADRGLFKGFDLVEQSLMRLKTNKKIALISVGGAELPKSLKSKFPVLEFGWIKDDILLAELYQACDIFLMPSRQETFGMMSIEAMSCGKMVLALDCDGSALSEVINSPHCGLAVREEEYHRTLERLINYPNEIYERGLRSLEYARKNYSESVFMEGMVQIYREVMEKHQMDDDAKLLLEQLKKYSDKRDVNFNVYQREDRKNDSEEIGNICMTDKIKRMLFPESSGLYKDKARSALKRISWYLSPSYRMLVGNRERMKLLTDKVDRIESRGGRQMNLLLDEIKKSIQQEERRKYLAQPATYNENLVGQRVFIPEEKKSEIHKYECSNEEFFEKLKEFILRTDVVLDIGCGVRPQNFFVPRVHICVEPFKQYRDVVKPFLPNDTYFVFFKEDALTAIKDLDDSSVDSVFLMDVIEHLEKDEGEKLLKELDRVARRQIIVFTPYGFYPMHFREEGQKDAWGLDGTDVQEHKSGWLPEDFGEGWDFHVCVGCHEAFLPGEKKAGKRYDALMAIKTKKFSGFPTVEGTPGFVIDEYEKRFVE